MITNVNGVLDTLKIVTLFQYIEQNQTIFIKSRLLILEWISNVLLQVTCVVVSVALFVALFADYMIFYIMGRHC
jgi:signal transduction histidine kinase